MKYTIDRIENGIAVCENSDGKFIEIPLSVLPDSVKDGDILQENEGKFIVDIDATEQAREEMFHLQSSIFGKQKQ